MSQVTNNLTHSGFQMTEEEEEADILWKYNHIKNYRSAIKSRERPLLPTFISGYQSSWREQPWAI